MTSDQEDLVSVIIPFYNEKYYFEDCLNSVLNQTYSNLEIIIVNDGSDDIYYNILNNFEHKYKGKIKIFHKENGGVSSARNLGIEKANGNYIAFIDADDSWLPFKIEHQLKIMKKNNYNFIHGSYFILDENESFKGKFVADNLTYNKLIKSCDIGLSTVMLTSNLIKNNLFSNISTKEDYICWLKIVKKISVLYGDQKVVTLYRKKIKSLSSSFIIKFINAFKVYNKYENKNLFISLLNTVRLSLHYLYKQNKIVYKNPYPIEFKYIMNFSKLNFDNSFVLVALNMASLSNTNFLYFNYNKLIFWIDGYCAKFLIKNFKKTAGRKLIENINLPNSINKIYLCGKESQLQISYLEKVYQKKINFIKLPFFKNFFEISKQKLDFEDNSLVILNISTPKQEILANNILKYNNQKKIFIFCIGGGLAMACGEEKIVPINIEKMNLEWLWRLRTNTIFRIKRLLATATIFFSKKLIGFYKKIYFTELN